MNLQRLSIVGIATLLFLTVVQLINRSVHADNCCPPPRLPSVAARFQQNAQVTVYLDIRTGFDDEERKAIKAGFEDWNDEPNNSGVKYNVVETDNPPAPGGNNTIIATFVDSFGSHEAQLNMSDRRNSSGVVTSVSGVLTFWRNIRSGTPSMLPGFLRATTRHEGGHGIGLENSDSICPEGSNIMFPSRNQETFITTCDNAVIKTDPAYPSPTPTPIPTPTPTPEPCDLLQAQESGLATPMNLPCGVDEPDLIESGMGECNDGVDNDQDGLIDCDEGSCGHYCIGDCSNFQQELCVAIGAMGCWQGQCYTPILIDVNGDGFRMTNVVNGVNFKVLPNFSLTKLSWTAANSDDAWLVLDRNGNGTIDSGEEQFGNATPQPWSMEKNGFKALAQYDYFFNGGHEDGVIDARDAVFAQLQLWTDRNHNGISEPDELSDLPSQGLFGIELKYKEWKKTDEFGNAFRYRAKVLDSSGHGLGKWAFDVFLMTH